MPDDVPMLNDIPPPVDPPPWGKSLVREYRLILDQWQALDRLDRPGLPADLRTTIEAEKLQLYERLAVVRAQAVNEVLLLLRWAMEDAPGILEAILKGLDVPDVVKKLRPAILGEVDDRVDERLEPVRQAYLELRAAVGPARSKSAPVTT